MENKTIPGALDEETLFRYLVISSVLGWELKGWSRPQAIEAAATATHYHQDGAGRRVSERSIYRWLKDYQTDGLSGLVSMPRQGTGTRRLSPELVTFFAGRKAVDPCVSIPELIDQAREHGLLEGDSSICRTTVWRELNRQGVSTKRTTNISKADNCRRYAYPHRMDLVLCDGKHFRAGVDRKRRVALIFLDDATRYALEVVVGTSENTHLFLRGLYKCLFSYGRMRAMFLDNGAGFKNNATTEVLAKLGILLIHGTPGYPEGRGKIERFNRTLLAKVLRYLVGKVEVDPACEALENRIRHYLNHQYNHTIHESLNGLTPRARFTGDKRSLDRSQCQDMRGEFVIWEQRRVSNDHVVSYDGVDYEVPTGYRQRTARLQYHLLDQTLSLFHDKRLVRLHPVNLLVNAQRVPGRTAKQQEESIAPLPPGSAEISFARDTSPIVDADGNFFKKDKS